MTSNTPLTECQLEPPDSCRPMKPITLWLHAPWPCPLGLCLLYPLDITRVVWPDITFSLVHPGWDERYLGLSSIRESVTVAGSWPKIRLPVTKTPLSDPGYFLFRIHTCQTWHLAHAITIAIALKPMVTGTLISSSAILDQWPHRKLFLYRRLLMQMVDSSMPIELDVDPI